MVIQVGNQDFDKIIRESKKTAVVNFSTLWCPYCKKLKPIVDEISNEYADKLDVYYVDTDERQDLAERYRIMTVPTVFVFKNGEVMGKAVNPGTKSVLLDLIF